MSSFSILTPRSSLSKDLILELISVRENKYTVMIDFRKSFFFFCLTKQQHQFSKVTYLVFFFLWSQINLIDHFCPLKSG